jgi:hypothetical protein
MEDLIKEGAAIVAELKAKQDRLAEINSALEAKVDFNGKKTGRITGAGIEVKVVKRDNTIWDQERLAQIHQNAQVFEGIKLPEIFQHETKIKPVSSKAIEVAMAMNEEFANAVNWARTITPGKSTVIYERLEEG